MLITEKIVDERLMLITEKIVDERLISSLGGVSILN